MKKSLVQLVFMNPYLAIDFWSQKPNFNDSITSCTDCLKGYLLIFILLGIGFCLLSNRAPTCAHIIYHTISSFLAHCVALNMSKNGSKNGWFIF